MGSETDKAVRRLITIPIFQICHVFNIRDELDLCPFQVVQIPDSRSSLTTCCMITNGTTALPVSLNAAAKDLDIEQVIPTPRPHERVVFLPHFLRGLGFPLHPFVRGLMFYYGLDFHDLAPNFILNISAFIVVCEAFLRIQPHFGLWLKVFNVKPKVVDGQHAECGAPWWASGRLDLKFTNPTWPDDVVTARGIVTGPDPDDPSRTGAFVWIEKSDGTIVLVANASAIS